MPLRCCHPCAPALRCLGQRTWLTETLPLIPVLQCTHLLLELVASVARAWVEVCFAGGSSEPFNTQQVMSKTISGDSGASSSFAAGAGRPPASDAAIAEAVKEHVAVSCRACGLSRRPGQAMAASRAAPAAARCTQNAPRLPSAPPPTPPGCRAHGAELQAGDLSNPGQAPSHPLLLRSRPCPCAALPPPPKHKHTARTHTRCLPAPTPRPTQ